MTEMTVPQGIERTDQIINKSDECNYNKTYYKHNIYKKLICAVILYDYVLIKKEARNSVLLTFEGGT